ncbi:MAG: AraC family transcriptional regulator [Gammaproteobacteria bacterium]|nr:AraC family transcriptional regulator [Gammaproteobacteria bacterium]
MPTGQFANYHIETDGKCRVITTSADRPVRLRKGDMVLKPGGDSHALVDSLQSEIISADELLNNVPKTRSNKMFLAVKARIRAH